MTNRPHGTLYVGVTSNLAQRIWQHREGITGGFTSQYKLTRLAFVEPHERITEAIRHEKLIKKWPRAFKMRLIEAANPGWDDLYAKLLA